MADINYRGAWSPTAIYRGPIADDNTARVADTVSWLGATYAATFYTIDVNPAYGNYTGWSLVSGTPNFNTVEPAPPTNFKSVSTTDHSALLTWDAALVPGIGEVSSYTVYQNGQKVGQTTGTSFNVTGLSAVTSYKFTVSATDITGSSGPTPYSTSYTNPDTHVTTVTDRNPGAAPNPDVFLTTTTAHASTGKYFSPYIDVGLPAYDLYNISKASGVTSFTLAFQNSSYSNLDASSYSGDPANQAANGAMAAPTLKSGSAPVISFGGLPALTTPTGALIDEINQIQHSQGGVITASIGGYTGIDPAVIAGQYAVQLRTSGLSTTTANAQAAAALQGQFQSVMNTFGVTHLDFDIETEQTYTYTDKNGVVQFTNDGSALPAGGTNPQAGGDPQLTNKPQPHQYTTANDLAANTLRNTAIIALEAANPGMGVTFTVATDTTGLGNSAYGGDVLGLVRTAVASGVRIDALNLMVMDFNANDMAGASQADRAIAAAKSVHTQFPNLKIALTPMIGQNDSASGVTTLADAAKIAAFVLSNPWVVGSGEWQFGRDMQGTNGNQTNSAQPSAVQTYHSGVQQNDYDFAKIFQSTTSVNRAALTNDLNGDFASELVFRNNNNGTIVSWTDGKSTAAANLGMVSASSYSMLGADLNGDGKSDLVFRSTSGDVIVWDGGVSSTGHMLGNVPSNSYSMIAGDLNGDGKSDLIFRSTASGSANGTIVVWDGGVSSTAHVLGVVPTNYSLQAGDLNGDGKADLVFRNSNGDIVVWDGGVPSTAHMLGNVGTSYSMQLGDLNGDGKADVIFRSSANGTIVVWDGGNANLARNAGMVSSTSYTMDVADLNGDGKSDLVFHDISSGGSGVVVAWDSGLASLGHAVGTVGGDWTVLGG